jgi:fructokinase
MQIGIDLGATKIEYVLLNNNNNEIIRNRIPTPNNYDDTLLSIISIVKDLEKKNNKKLNLGICHPGATDKMTGLIKNAHNSQWLNNKNIVKDLKKK